MADPEDLPYNPYRAWSESVLDRDKTLAQEIHLHLQKIGKYVKAEDLVDFMDTKEMRERTKLDRRIHGDSTTMDEEVELSVDKNWAEGAVC